MAKYKRIRGSSTQSVALTNVHCVQECEDSHLGINNSGSDARVSIQGAQQQSDQNSYPRSPKQPCSRLTVQPNSKRTFSVRIFYFSVVGPCPAELNFVFKPSSTGRGAGRVLNLHPPPLRVSPVYSSCGVGKIPRQSFRLKLLLPVGCRHSQQRPLRFVGKKRDPKASLRPNGSRTNTCLIVSRPGTPLPPPYLRRRGLGCGPGGGLTERPPSGLGQPPLSGTGPPGAASGGVMAKKNREKISSSCGENVHPKKSSQKSLKRLSLPIWMLFERIPAPIPNLWGFCRSASAPLSVPPPPDPWTQKTHPPVFSPNRYPEGSQ